MSSVTRVIIATAIILSGTQANSQVNSSVQKQQLQLLNQLDQLDKLDLKDALDAANACADKEDFPCAEAKIKEAKLLVVDDEDTKAIAQAQSYLSGKITARDQRISEQKRQAAARDEAAANALLNYLGNVWNAWKEQGKSSSISSTSSYSSTSQSMSSTCKIISIKQTSSSVNRTEFEGEAMDSNGKHAITAFVDIEETATGIMSYEKVYAVYARRNFGFNKTSLGYLTVQGGKGPLEAPSLREAVIKGYEKLNNCVY